MRKPIIYHKTHSFIQNGSKVTCLTQLYKLGVYCIINNNSANQYCIPPIHMVKVEKLLKRKNKEHIISNLEFGRIITVTDESGFWEEVKEH